MTRPLTKHAYILLADALRAAKPGGLTAAPTPEWTRCLEEITKALCLDNPFHFAPERFLAACGYVEAPSSSIRIRLRP
jgi:hypothetical protein